MYIVLFSFAILVLVGFRVGKRGGRRTTKQVETPVRQVMEISDSMFEENSAFLFAWSDVFYNFLGIASNDCRSITKLSVTPLQDIMPNDLA